MSMSRLEIRVGAFVMLGLIALTAMIILFGFRNVKLIHDTYPLTVIFHYTNGLEVGAPVRYSGVEVGKVTGIEFSEQETNDVYVEMDVKKTILIRKDARLMINSLGIMGEKYIEIIPRSAHADVALEGEKIKGEEPMPLSDVMSEALGFVDKLEKTMDEIFDDATKEDIKKTLANIERLTGEEIHNKLTTALDRISNVTGPDIKEKILGLLENYNKVAGSLTKVIGSESGELHELFVVAQRLMRNLEPVLISLRESKGTLGLLVSDPQAYENLNKTLVNLNEWVTMIRKHGLLYKEKDVRSNKSSDRRDSNRGYLTRSR